MYKKAELVHFLMVRSPTDAGFLSLMQVSIFFLSIYWLMFFFVEHKHATLTNIWDEDPRNMVIKTLYCDQYSMCGTSYSVKMTSVLFL